MTELAAEALLPDFLDLSCEKLSAVEPVSFAETQERASSAILRLNTASQSCPSLLLSGYPGVNYEKVIIDLIDDCPAPYNNSFDLCYTENLSNPFRPIWLKLKAGSGIEFCELLDDLFKLLRLHLDAEEVVKKILKKQDNDEKLAGYLTELSAHVAQDGAFTHPVLMNLMIHQTQQQPPVIYARDLTWRSLFGAINYVTEQGSVYSNHHLLEPGLLREANGGYLIIPVDELLMKPQLWFKLHNALTTGYLDWSTAEDTPPQTPFFQPEATPLDIKLILVGDRISIAEFNLLDNEFAEKTFLRTDLVTEFPYDEDSHNLFIGLLSHIHHHWQLLDFDASAIKELMRFSCRLCEHQQILSFAENQLVALMQLANSIAKEQGNELVSVQHIKAALAEQEHRLNYIVEQSDQGIVDEQILLQTEGEVVGQINGLSVIQIMGHPYDFGEPVRLTATVHMGDGDVSDIERKAELAGHIHAKAMMIIHGYLSTLFGAENPSPLSANLVFEQSYSEIDGDSAALTGLCALLSALAKQPIYQHLAVTGAVDQFGNVQPVGGLNEKIEGFFRVCSIQGLNGKQGVVIPESNQLQLILSDEVIEAVKNGQFHIYPVSHVEEAVELLMGCPAGSIDDDQTLFGRIRERLDDLNGSAGRNGLFSTLFRRLHSLVGLA